MVFRANWVCIDQDSTVLYYTCIVHVLYMYWWSRYAGCV